MTRRGRAVFHKQTECVFIYLFQRLPYSVPCKQEVSQDFEGSVGKFGNRCCFI